MKELHIDKKSMPMLELKIKYFNLAGERETYIN